MLRVLKDSKLRVYTPMFWLVESMTTSVELDYSVKLTKSRLLVCLKFIASSFAIVKEEIICSTEIV